ncbi:DNA mismatch repair protein MutS [Candidatus Cyanaurora vandensis]|uniref:DNA mismatch repair protein MutS n=1 Tax=Candidatus Cyanaurora vandensis TaxID=2714958 RepID=UPI00257D2A56|nr:DNA mismatch repair protein MutS [Candidatus Cyanaurora vandensis]
MDDHNVQTSLDLGISLADTTPMMRQFLEIKQQYRHCILLYRMGDFYETFFEDAELISRELGVVLTGRQAGEALGRVPMAGVPHHALERYAAQLIEKGYGVAVCDQMEEAGPGKKLVRRDVTRVITPGTVLEEGLLTAKKNNYLVALVAAGDHWGLAYSDVSTGEFRTTQVNHPDQLVQELWRLDPAEILLPSDAPDPVRLLRPGTRDPQIPDFLPAQFGCTLRPSRQFLLEEARETLLSQFKVRSLEGYGCAHLPLALRAAGGLVRYLSETQCAGPLPLASLSTYSTQHFMVLDPQTTRNLELIQTSRDGSFYGSLLWALDRTKTAMGGRCLRRWLVQPLLDPDLIRQRQDTVQELVDDPDLCRDLQSFLSQLYDLERLASRIRAKTANARDLVGLGHALSRLPELERLLVGVTSSLLQLTLNPVLEPLGKTIGRTLVEHPPLYLTEGGLIRDGINTELDQLKKQGVDDQQWLINLETQERQRTGIPNLKVSYNRAFGYYIEISRGKAGQAPDDYIRKQTLTNQERFITPELKEREARIQNSQKETYQLEYETFVTLRQEVSNHSEAIRHLAQHLAQMDTLASLAEVATYQRYTRPTLDTGRVSQIVQGRHPVIEQTLSQNFFVPNDTQLGDQTDLVILTGPNMSGKSSYLRQIGLIQLLAQVGSFVPAQTCHLGICDRIFTRVGAVDDLATGVSTFMVEMTETANILHHGTPRSLVLLDEIGRGTATFDGLAIAWSVAEYLLTVLQSRTIFATHYHELNELAATRPRVANFQVAVKELAESIVFLHQVIPGGADRSYGIEVGRLAGLPPTVLQRARFILAQVERHSHIALGLRTTEG